MTYEAKSSGNDMMGNNAPSKTVGIAYIQIKMHDGIVRTLTNVYHVPELKWEPCIQKVLPIVLKVE